MAFGPDQVKFAREAADQSYEALINFFGGKITSTGETKDAGFWALLIAQLLSGVVLVLAVAVSVIAGVTFRIGAGVAAIFLLTLEEVRHDNQDALNTTIAAAMSDLLSVPITGADIPAGGDPQAQLDRARVIGGKLHELLLTEFGGKNGPEGVNGELAARAFSGFNINFNTGAALLSILTEISSLGKFTQFREVGEMMAQGLSLGRLHRQALKPLIDNLIVHPYTRQLGAQYRQTRMSEADIINAFNAGLIEAAQFDADMHDKGYRDADTTALAALHSAKLSFQDVDTLLRHKVITFAQAQAFAQRMGFNFEDGDKYRTLPSLSRQDALEDSYVREAFQLARDRHITESDFQQAMDSTSLPDGEKQLWAQRLSLHLQHPGKHIGLAQLLYLGEHSQITDVEVDAWIERQGYSPEDAGLLHLYVLGKELDYEAAQQKKACATAKAALKSATTASTAAAKTLAAAQAAFKGATAGTAAGLQAALDRATLANNQAQQKVTAAQQKLNSLGCG